MRASKWPEQDVSAMFYCGFRSRVTLNLEVGEQLGVMSRLPMNPLRPRWTASPVHHPQAPARESR